MAVQQKLDILNKKQNSFKIFFFIGNLIKIEITKFTLL